MWNPDDVLASLAEPLPDGPWPAGAPARDFLRSPAAARVGRLASVSGLRLFHFEHRFPLDLPAHWVAPGMEEDAEAPRWFEGVLPERKYQSFRHDLLLGSFHPGHRGKWSTHELCHGLVGFAFQPGAPALFHATAGRLAELLPVVLYYFLDEIGLARCPLHQGGGPLFRTYCAACEEAAAARPITKEDRAFAADAARFLAAELAAVARTRREGRPIPHRWANLDLCSDGLAYADAHGQRLSSVAMERLSAFFAPQGGCSETLDALEARVVEVARGIALGEPVTLLAPTPEAGEDRFVRQDLAFRLLTVREEADEGTAERIDGLVDLLEVGSIAQVVDGWRQLADDVVVPGPEQIFAVGYSVPGLEGLGRMTAQVLDGLKSVCPLTVELAEDAGLSLGDFPDPPVRAPLGDRFVAWLTAEHPDVAPLAAFETAIRSVKPDPWRAHLGTDGEALVLCDGTRVLQAPYDVLATAEAVEKGETTGVRLDGRLVLSPAPPAEPWAMVVGRHLGELVMLEVDPEDAQILADGGVPEVAPALVEHGVMRPSRYPL